MSLVANWSYPTSIRIGEGRIRELGDACQAAGIDKPLLVTDRGLASQPVTEQTLQIMHEAGLGKAMFAEVDPNPNEHNLQDGIIAFKEGGHDGIIALGGGSGIDLGKTVAFMAGQSRPVWDFEDLEDWWTRADQSAIAPAIAVPTTAGTGSEVGRASVITNTATNVKKIIFHPKMLPCAVICDPRLTISMPKHITAGTGMDAFAHCVEAFSSPAYHPMSHGIALEGMRLVKEYLHRAWSDPTDIEARTQMMAAAAMGSIAFQKGLGAIHAMSHPVGALLHSHHGTTNAVCMPAVLEFNASAIAEGFGAAAGYLGISGGFAGFCDYVRKLIASMEMPDTLSKLGVEESHIDDFAEKALSDPTCKSNPIKLTKENLKELYLAAL